MPRYPRVARIGALALAATAIASPPALASGGQTRQISSSGTTAFGATSQGSDTFQFPEILGQAGSDGGATGFAGPVIDRSVGGPPGHAGSTSGAAQAKSNPELITSFDGLYHRQQRLANGGNQFSVEPPDQGLCAGGGFVLETVNDVTRVYDTAGTPLTGVEDLNSFFGYPAAINRSTGTFGQFVTDPSCFYDPATQRWFMTVLTLETNPATGRFTGANHLDVAVSRSSDPTGTWTIYRVPAQDDGTQGTPNHRCSFGPCLGDYPHLGADANGFYVTTNEYSFSGPEFHGAQVYALSKRALESGAGTASVTQFDLHGPIPGVGDYENGFTLAPSTSPDGVGDTAAGGTEYFMSSNAAAEATDPGTGASAPRSSSQILVWSLSNTSSLDGTPALTLRDQAVGAGLYANPPQSDQKPGSTPLAACLNDTKCSTFLLGGPDPFAPETEYKLDSSDTRMLQVSYANGKLWGALDTALTLGAANKAGVEWFIVKPTTGAGALTAQLARSGYLGLAGNNLTYPAIGVTASGRGVMAFTVLGADHFPSAGYASIDALAGVGDVHIAKEGLGPADGFSGYKAFGSPPGTIRPRWGDYGASAVDGNTIWIASEYIGQTCTLAQYEATPFGSCGGTRSTLANWDTRISSVGVR